MHFSFKCKAKKNKKRCGPLQAVIKTTLSYINTGEPRIVVTVVACLTNAYKVPPAH